MGNELLGRTNYVRQISNSDNTPHEYEKGNIVFKNSIDLIQYLLENRELVGDAIGVSPSDIFKNRRDQGIVSQYIAKMLSKFELGDPKQNLQMFISLKDNNASGLYSYQEWADYIMTPEWVKSLAGFCT